MAKTRKTIKILSCILCDDIRREANNKYSLMGVYSNDILVSEIPVKFSISFWVEFLTKFEKKMDITFRLASRSLEGKGRKKQVVRLDGTIEAKIPVESISLPIPKLSLKFEQEEMLFFEYQLPGGRWKEIKRFAVKKKPKEETKKK